MKDVVIDIDGHGQESEMFAYVAIDKNGKSSICAGETFLGLTPFIGMTRQDMKRYEAAVQNLRNETGKTIKLIRYVASEIIE